MELISAVQVNLSDSWSGVGHTLLMLHTMSLGLSSHFTGSSNVSLQSPTLSVCDFSLLFAQVYLEGHRCTPGVFVAQVCVALCDPMDCTLPGSSVCGISSQECWHGLPFPSPGESSQPRFWTWVSHCRQILYWLSRQGGPDSCSLCFNKDQVVWTKELTHSEANLEQRINTNLFLFLKQYFWGMFYWSPISPMR